MKFILAIIISLSFCILQAQDTENTPLFRAGVTAGFNASQLDGDNFGGYSKVGLHAGLVAVSYTHLTLPTICSV